MRVKMKIKSKNTVEYWENNDKTYTKISDMKDMELKSKYTIYKSSIFLEELQRRGIEFNEITDRLSI
jgi:hypothetical protein